MFQNDYTVMATHNLRVFVFVIFKQDDVALRLAPSDNIEDD